MEICRSWHTIICKKINKKQQTVCWQQRRFIRRMLANIQFKIVCFPSLTLPKKKETPDVNSWYVLTYSAMFYILQNVLSVI